MLLSVDPGVRACGVALWTGQLPGHQLIAAALVRNPTKWGQDVGSAVAMAHAIRVWVESFGACLERHGPPHLVIECPRVYDAAFQKGDQNTSIVPLTLVVGACAMALPFCEVTQFFPRDWKGTLDGDTLIRDRIIPALSESERTRVQLPAASLAHNVWDGVGVGLKYLGRLEPRRAFHRES